MSLAIPVPAANDDRVELADWIELEAVQSQDGASSFMEFARQIHMTGSTDAMGEEPNELDRLDPGGEQSEQVATDAWAEIERRHKACGGDSGFYPFNVTARSIVLRHDWDNSPYIFQLLLKQFGLRAGPEGTFPERLFEHLSALAAKNYLGGEVNQAQSYCFGFPRPDGTNFVDALRRLCEAMNAGRVRLDDPRIKREKDSHLDVVVWRPFADGHSSQLILFGQCGVGRDWSREKLTELQPRNFRDKWLVEGFYPEPVRMFFVPRCIEDRDWRTAAIDGGIIFDRCRITALVGNEEDEERDQRRNWTMHVVNRLRAVI
ncbi:MAG: hypothetical protein GXP27_22415 [Planctomycetes bacterium]|nr:hypothetical protein [Planctomycetota bacterium]